MRKIMNNPIIDKLTFGRRRVRTYFDESGTRWYSAMDVCYALGIRHVFQAFLLVDPENTAESTYDTLGRVTVHSLDVNIKGLFELVALGRELKGACAVNPFSHLDASS